MVAPLLILMCHIPANRASPAGEGPAASNQHETGCGPVSINRISEPYLRRLMPWQRDTPPQPPDGSMPTRLAAKHGDGFDWLAHTFASLLGDWEGVFDECVIKGPQALGTPLLRPGTTSRWRRASLLQRWMKCLVFTSIYRITR